MLALLSAHCNLYLCSSSMLKQKTADGSGDNQASKASSGFPHSTLSGTKPGSIPSQIQSQDAAKVKGDTIEIFFLYSYIVI